MNPSNHVRIVEVGARDGLQNEKTLLPAEVKIALIDRLPRPASGRSRRPASSARNGCRNWPMRPRCSAASARYQA